MGAKVLRNPKKFGLSFLLKDYSKTFLENCRPEEVRES